MSVLPPGGIIEVAMVKISWRLRENHAERVALNPHMNPELGSIRWRLSEISENNMSDRGRRGREFDYRAVHQEIGPQFVLSTGCLPDGERACFLSYILHCLSSGLHVHGNIGSSCCHSGGSSADFIGGFDSLSHLPGLFVSPLRQSFRLSPEANVEDRQYTRKGSAPKTSRYEPSPWIFIGGYLVGVGIAVVIMGWITRRDKPSKFNCDNRHD